MRPLEDAVRNEWRVADFSVMMVAVDLVPQQIGHESRFRLCPDDHRRRVWRRSGQREDPTFIIARPTGPQSGVMVWGVISFDIPLVVIRGTLTASCTSKTF
ncbi:transposable element Tc1 transposase [Trichonephila clavipes]|nr:transposable element Tc1 transposase [Trichonephila clavipes]